MTSKNKNEINDCSCTDSNGSADRNSTDRTVSGYSERNINKSSQGAKNSASDYVGGDRTRSSSSHRFSKLNPGDKL